MLDTSIVPFENTDTESTQASSTAQHNVTVQMMPVDKLVPFKFGNSRRKISEKGLADLGESLKREWINPITVRTTNKGESFEVIAGNRRWKAALLAGFQQVPVNIKVLSDADAYELHIRENYDREDISLVEEAKAAQQFVSLYEGDHQTASQVLGWSVKKVKDRLNLLRCTEAVLDALDEGTIELGHAIVLSSFTEKLQNGTLAKIITEKWTVKYLKERAGKAKKRIAHAKFNTTECEQCPHNTISQQDMFSVGIEEDAQCANLSCWKTKTDAWLESRKFEVEERFGKVLLWVESGENDRNTVAPSVVGEAQYSQCVNCESNVVIMDDRDRKEGELTKSQCIDKMCFDKCVKKFENANKPKPAPKPQSEKKGNATASKSVDNPIKEKETTVASKPTAKVIEREKDVLAQACFEKIKDSKLVQNTIILALVQELTGYKGLGDGVSSFDDTVKKFQSLSLDELETHTQTALVEFLRKSQIVNSDTGSKTPNKLLLSILSTLDIKKDVAVRAWTADTITLNNYRVDGIIELCKQSGFVDAFDAHPKNIETKTSFAKIAKKSKKQFIEAITAFDFDWSDFAPETHLKHMK